MSVSFVRGVRDRTGINARATKQRPINRADAAQSRIYPALLRSTAMPMLCGIGNRRAAMPTVALSLLGQPHA